MGNIANILYQRQHPGERYYGHWESPDAQRGLTPAAQGRRI